jgi:hypothetical protein
VNATRSVGGVVLAVSLSGWHEKRRVMAAGSTLAKE